MAFDPAPYSGAITTVADLASNVIKRIFPEKMSESEAAQLKTQITLELMKEDWGKVEKEYQDRADARALAKADVDKGNWFTNVLAATVRPVFGYVVMAAFFASLVPAFVPGGANFIVITDIQKEVMLSVIYFYFGGRTVEKGLSIWMGKNDNGKSSTLPS